MENCELWLIAFIQISQEIVQDFFVLNPLVPYTRAYFCHLPLCEVRTEELVPEFGSILRGCEILVNKPKLFENVVLWVVVDLLQHVIELIHIVYAATDEGLCPIVCDCGHLWKLCKEHSVVGFLFPFFLENRDFLAPICFRPIRVQTSIFDSVVVKLDEIFS